MIQLLREWPPGFGGIERTAHGLADALGGEVVSLRRGRCASDPLPVHYRRRHLASLAIGRLLLVLPSPGLLRLLCQRDPLIAHLPCPSVLLLALLARICRPGRLIHFYWHAFIEPRSGVSGWLELLYLRAALRLLRGASVITTSPVLRHYLIAAGLAAESISVLPCCLPAAIEDDLLAQRCQRLLAERRPGRLIFIGRLDSYKRVDWLLDAFSSTPAALQLDVIGEGPDRMRLERQARRVARSDQRVAFHGRLDERHKQQLLLCADLLILPSNRCNEAFGIVQLEAMASGIPALAFDLPRSGMHWVSALPALEWGGSPADLVTVMHAVLRDQDLYRMLCRQASDRYDNLFARKVWLSTLNRVLERCP